MNERSFIVKPYFANLLYFPPPPGRSPSLTSVELLIVRCAGAPHWGIATASNHHYLVPKVPSPFMLRFRIEYCFRSVVRHNRCGLRW